MFTVMSALAFAELVLMAASLAPTWAVAVAACGFLTLIVLGIVSFEETMDMAIKKHGTDGTA